MIMRYSDESFTSGRNVWVTAIRQSGCDSHADTGYAKYTSENSSRSRSTTT